MASDSTFECNSLLYRLTHTEGCRSNLTQPLSKYLSNYCGMLQDLEVEHDFSKPMPWIGIYIAVASLFCILAMAADLFHGFWSRKLWFPCKYFKLNAASITVIAVAMKLPADLNTPMPGPVDQFAKLGSMTFICTMMANLMPSLATMDNQELVTNGIALGILVITVIVNFCIQIKTGVIGYFHSTSPPSRPEIIYGDAMPLFLAIITLFSLALLTSLALTIPTSKQILETKYQAAHKTPSNDRHPQNLKNFIVEKLKQHVINYWIMAETGSPQFVMACSSLCSTSGVICASIALIHVFGVSTIILHYGYYMSGAEYRWSMIVILMTQFVGVIVGTIAPVFRCFTALSFELSMKWSNIHIFRVESYYTQKLQDWKHSRIDFQTGGRKFKIFVHNVKSIFLSCCIWLDKIIVVACKIIGLGPSFVVMCVWCCLYCWKLLRGKFSKTPIASNTEHEQQEQNARKDLRNYVLQLQDESILAERTLKLMSNSVDRIIQQAEKWRPSNLLKLLEKSIDFKGVESFDSDQIPPLLSAQHPNCWSLPVITLTSIAVTLPHIQKDTVDWLLNSVGEGLFYASLVEESLNGSDELVNVQQVAKRLWLEVEVHCKWLENNLQRNVHQGKTSKEILQWFSDKAEDIVSQIQKSTYEGWEKASMDKSIAANSMYRIAKTIQLNIQGRIEEYSDEQLFLDISSTIANILAACITNLPRVIEMKCYQNAIGKREESVEAAAQLLGQSKEMINKLNELELPRLDADQMAFIDQWRSSLRLQFP